MTFAKILQSQRVYFESGITRDLEFRKAQLRHLKSLLKENEALLLSAIHNDFHKSGFDTYVTELGLLYRDIDECTTHLNQWAKTRKVKTDMANQPGKSYILAEPLGNCLVIGTWNYPFQLSLAPVIAAMAAGNTVVLKPSELAKNCSSALARLVNENFPPEYLFVAEGGVPETNAILEERFDKIFFTGSTTVGRIVYQAAARHLTPVTLELGGKNPVIVSGNCNLKDAAKRVVWAKFLNAGQTCVAPDHVFVEESVYQEFLTQCTYWIQTFDYNLANNNYVQIINDHHFQRIQELTLPEKVYCGGIFDVEQRTISPTILTDVAESSPIMQEEIFGPVLPVFSYSNLDTVIRQIRNRPKPLAAYLFTKNMEEKNRLLRQLSFGGGAINETIMHLTSTQLPFGGVGLSGFGSYHGEAGFATFSHYKSILERLLPWEPSLRYPPNTEKKLKWVKRFLK
ncbi:MAG: aldehyde dehydrogenase [Bacteroidetes bacterium]|nr:aldehyde dehydrogenase [Bacteroidota bacterium]